MVSLLALAGTGGADRLIGRMSSAPLFAAIVVIAWLVGIGPAILASALGVVALDYLADVPGRAWHVSLRDLSWMVLFLVIAVAMAWLVSERRRLEDQRAHLLALERTARAEAEDANRAKDEFLAMVSHEVKTPLMAIQGWLHVLRSGKLEPAQAARAFDTIDRNVRIQAKLVDDLLDVSRAVAGKLQIAMRTVDLAQIVRHVVQSTHPRALAAGVALTLQAPTTDVAVLGDVERLQQVLGNVLGNAIKFTPRGGRVDVLVQHETDVARVTVRDTGHGIDPALLPHVFDRFRQGRSAAGRPEGLGLGLAIAKHIVEEHGGRITAESDGLEHGATFVVELPCTPLDRSTLRVA